MAKNDRSKRENILSDQEHGRQEQEYEMRIEEQEAAEERRYQAMEEERHNADDAVYEREEMWATLREEEDDRRRGHNKPLDRDMDMDRDL